MKTVMSANLFLAPGTAARRRADEFARRIQVLDVDILCLQEAHTYGLLEYLAEMLGPVLPYVICEEGMFGPAGGLAILSRTPIERQRFVSVANATNSLGRREVIGSLAFGAVHKGILVAQTRDTIVANVHLSPNHYEDWADGYRPRRVQAAQMEVVIAEIQALGDAERFCICGDFNIDKQGGLYRRFLLETGLFDPFDARPTFSGRKGKLYCLDWMGFGGRSGRPRATMASVLFEDERRSARHIRHALSDHSPILATVDW